MRRREKPKRQHEDVSHLPPRAEPNPGLAPVDLALEPRRRLEPRLRHRRFPQRPHEPLHRVVAAAVPPAARAPGTGPAPRSRPTTPGAAGTQSARSVKCPTAPPAGTASTPSAPGSAAPSSGPGPAREQSPESTRPYPPDDGSPPTAPVRPSRPPRASAARERSRAHAQQIADGSSSAMVESTTGAVAVGGWGQLFPAAFARSRCLTPRRGSVSSRRSSVGSRAGAPPVGSGGSSGAFALGLSPAPVGTFPAPASSNPACRFPALGFPVAFVSRVMRPFKPGALSANRRLGIRRTARAAHITSAYSTSSSRTPVARAVASGVAVPSSRPSPSRD